MNRLETNMGTTFLLGETVTDAPLQHPVGFVHFETRSTVKRGFILDAKLTGAEARAFWTESFIGLRTRAGGGK